MLLITTNSLIWGKIIELYKFISVILIDITYFKITAFQDKTSCSFIKNLSSTETCCIHLHWRWKQKVYLIRCHLFTNLKGVTSHPTVILVGSALAKEVKIRPLTARSAFDPRAFQILFVVDIVLCGKVSFSQYFDFRLSVSSHRSSKPILSSITKVM
jgi:hypothetical protein